MQRWYTPIVVAAALGLVSWKLWPRPLATSTRSPAADRLVAATQEPEPCAERERCVVVYLAPWCPSCKAYLPYLLDARSAWKDSKTRGIKLVIGTDRPDKIEALAKQIGEGAYMDLDGEYARAMGVRHYPTVWVTDQNGSILHVDKPAIQWLHDDLYAKK